MKSVFEFGIYDDGSIEVLAVYTSEEEADKAYEDYLRLNSEELGHRKLFVQEYPLYDKYERVTLYTRICRLKEGKWEEAEEHEKVVFHFQAPKLAARSYPLIMWAQGRDRDKVEEEYNRLKAERGI